MHYPVGTLQRKRPVRRWDGLGAAAQVNTKAFELSRRRDGRCRVGFPWGLLAV
jgi:hypothetical protein